MVEVSAINAWYERWMSTYVKAIKGKQGKLSEEESVPKMEE